MMNTLSDLNNYLFEQIERMTDDELTEEQLQKEILRSSRADPGRPRHHLQGWRQNQL